MTGKSGDPLTDAITAYLEHAVRQMATALFRPVVEHAACPTCFGDKTVTNGSASPDSPPGSVTWCQTCHGTGGAS